MFAVDAADPTPIYAQLERSIRAAIASGALATGDKLPTVRRLAVDLHVNPNTVAKVYAALERAGVLATRRGAGTFVRENPSRTTVTSRRDRDRELRPLVDRLFADAVAVGISFSEVVQYIHDFAARHASAST